MAHTFKDSFKNEADVNAKPGEIISTNNGIIVTCGTGLLQITELQMPGGKRLNAVAFVQGHTVKAGDLLS